MNSHNAVIYELEFGKKLAPLAVRHKLLTLRDNCGIMYISLEEISGLRYLKEGCQPDFKG